MRVILIVHARSRGRPCMNDTETQFLDVLYRGVLDGTEFERALSLIQEMFHCRAAALVSVDAQAPRTSIALASGVFADQIDLFNSQFAAIDPAPATFARMPIGTALSTDRMMSPQELNGAFVNEFLRPSGVVETLGGNLSSKQARFQLIGLQRGNDRPQFDDDDIIRLERLMPHLVRAMQLRRAFFDMKAEMTDLRALVDRLPVGVVLLGSGGRALFVNAAMRAVAQRADGFSLDRVGRPYPVNRAASQRLGALLDNVAKGGSGGILTVPRADTARDYVVLVAPLPSTLAGTGLDAAARDGAIILTHDPERRTRHTVDVLQEGLHLPRAAARLVATLAADGDLKSFAEHEAVTIHTARFHLRTAFARTGARTQTELVRMAVRLLRDFALAGEPP